MTSKLRSQIAACILASVVLAYAAVCRSAEEPPTDISAILARIQIILPTKEENISRPVAKETTSDSTVKKSPEELAEEARAKIWREGRDSHFKKWTRHEDEFISFLFPDDPRVKLEIKKPEDDIPVAGSPVRSAGISFFRCYQLTFKGDTYCLLLLDRQNEFDDSICFCGHVTYEKYLQHKGSLYRFSLLSNGKIKKIQILGDGMRLVFFEWTHLPIHPDVYAQIALSVCWHQPPRDLSSLVAKIKQTYGAFGFLEKGMDRDAIVSLLGPPTRENRDELCYVSQKSYDDPPGSDVVEFTRKIPLKYDRFVGISDCWEKKCWLPPEKNSVQWILARLGTGGLGSERVTPAKDNELKPLLARVIELMPKACEKHWGSLCHAAALLARYDVKDPRVPKIIKSRFLDPQLSATEASEALQEYRDREFPELVVKRIHLEMSLARRPDELAHLTESTLGWASLEGLFRYLQQTHPQRDALILEAMVHPHADVRMTAYSLWEELPSPTARAWLRKGLGDPSAMIRSHNAAVLVQTSASEAEVAKDLALLRDRLAKEKNKEVIDALKEAIKQLEGNKSESR